MINTSRNKDYILKSLILSYLLLILYDGSIRKWILPAYSSQIMLVKQIVAILIFIFGLKYFIKSSIWEKSFFIVGIILFLTSLIFGHGNLFVSLWGCLPFWFGLSVSYIIGKSVNQKDLYSYIRIIIITSIINSVLLILQFTLSPSHILNYRGYEVKSNIADISVSELNGGFRPPGLFMISNQNSLFILLSLSIIIFYIYSKSYIINKKILYISLFLGIIGSVCSASRTSIFYLIGIIIYSIYMNVNKYMIKKVIKTFFIIIPIVICLFLSPFGKSAVSNIGNRFEHASESQYKGETTMVGTLYDIYYRTIQYNVNALIYPKTLDGSDVPFWGYGQGMSTQVGGRMLNINKNSGFALAEFDGLRIVCESGLLLGWIVIYIRLGYVLRFIPYIIKIRRRRICLSAMLYPVFFISFYLLNTWGNAYQANISFLIAGLFLASRKFTYR